MGIIKDKDFLDLEARVADLEASGSNFENRLQLHADLIAAMRQNLTDINLERSRAAAGTAQDVPGLRIGTSGIPAVDPIHARAVADIVKRRPEIEPMASDNLLAVARDWVAVAQPSEPVSRRHRCVTAAALLLAEIERLDRAAAASIAEAAAAS